MEKTSIRRSGRLFTAATLVALTVLLLLIPAGAGASISAVATSDVDVYPTAQTGTPLFRLNADTRVIVLSLEGNWAQLDLGGEPGYVIASYLSFGEPSQEQAALPQTAESTAGFLRVETADANATVLTPTHGALNLRVYPDTRANVLASYTTGSRIKVMAQQDGWYYVLAGSETGYMAQAYLQLDEGVIIGESAGMDGIVQAPTDGGALVLRETPDTAGKSLGEYPIGTYVQVVAVGSKWLRVVVNEQEGYMMAPYVQMTTPNATSLYTVTSTDGNAITLYERPQTDSMSLATIPNGTTLIVITPQADWYEAQYMVNNEVKTGYVQSAALTVNTPYLDEMAKIPNG